MPPTHQNTFPTSTSQLLTNAIDLTQSVLTSSDSCQHQERIKRPSPDSAEAGPGRYHEFLSHPSLSDPSSPGSSSFQSWWGSRTLPCHSTLLRKGRLRHGATSGRAAAAVDTANRDRPCLPPHPTPRLSRTPRSSAPTSNHTPRQPLVPGPCVPDVAPPRARLHRRLRGLEPRNLKANSPGNPGSPLSRAPTNQRPPLAPTSTPWGPRLLGAPSPADQPRQGTRSRRGYSTPTPTAGPPLPPEAPRVCTPPS